MAEAGTRTGDTRIEESSLKQRIMELKQRELLIREERQLLEARLRNIVLMKYIDMLETVQSKKPSQVQ